jgi:hypothetical protein
MKNSVENARWSGFLTMAGFILLAFPVYLQAAWIFSSFSSPGHFEAVETFDRFLPGFLTLKQAAKMGFFLSALALLGGLASQLLWRKFRKSTTFLIIISGLLTLFNMFQLM